MVNPSVNCPSHQPGISFAAGIGHSRGSQLWGGQISLEMAGREWSIAPAVPRAY
ncbi:MAG TPA: hypothetical protein VMW00_06925 [Dehalococcoidales bacterium]|nr:hypothetical protein [Dehalococcoidales bacterium]